MNLKIERKNNVQLFPLQMLKLKSVKAFSLAEAMIALLIGSLILGFSAPMISRQLKSETLTNTQMQILQRQIETLRESNRTLQNDLVNLEDRLENRLASLRIPSGTVAFFNLTGCPDNTWTNVTTLGWGGYYFRVADASNPRNVAQAQSVQSHAHNVSMSLNLPNVGISWSGQGGGCPSGTCNHLTSITGSMHEVGTITSTTDYSGGSETRPRTIPLTVCVKN